MWKTASIPQRQAQESLTYKDDLNAEMVENAVEMVRRGSPDEKIIRNLADTWMLSTKRANLVLQQAKTEFTKPALQKFASKKTAQVDKDEDNLSMDFDRLLAAWWYANDYASGGDLLQQVHGKNPIRSETVHAKSVEEEGEDVVHLYHDLEAMGTGQAANVIGQWISEYSKTRQAQSDGHTNMYQDDVDTDGGFCPMCGGPGVPLGQLGHLMHYRCRNCGAQFSHDTKMDTDNTSMKTAQVTPAPEAAPDQVSQIMSYEQGDLDGESSLRLFSDLIKSGLVWKLQGHYGRTAKELIDRGFLDSQGRILKHFGGRTAQVTPAPEAAPEGTQGNPIIKTVGPSLKPLKKRSPTVPEEVSTEAADLPHKLEALAASMNDLNAQIQAITDDHSKQMKELQDKLADAKKEKKFDELVQQRQADIIALYDGIQELGDNADMVAKRFNDVVMVALKKSESDNKPPTAVQELNEVYFRLNSMNNELYKDIKAKIESWRGENTKFIQTITKELMTFPQTNPQRTRQPERGARRAQFLGKVLDSVGQFVEKTYQSIMGVVQDLTGMQAELDDIEQQLQGIQVTAGRVLRALKANDEVLVSVAALNEYSLPALSNESKAVRGQITAMAQDGCYVKMEGGSRFVYWDSIVGGTHNE